MSAAPTQELPQEKDLLVLFESQNLPDEYKEYYKIKRGNFFASIQNWPGMWKYYTLLDQIWFREFGILKPARDVLRTFPLLLYFNVHAKIRVSFELAFSGCMAESRSIMRDAIEFVAHAHTMMGDAELQKKWLAKDDNAASLEEFKVAYERHKKKGIFRGIEELHGSYGQLSETGSHATALAICERVSITSSDSGKDFKLNYCGLPERTWALGLFSLLLTCFTMENTFYGDFQTRLQFDEKLIGMRREFQQFKEQLREQMKIRYNVQPPFGIHIPKPVIFTP